MTTKRVDVSGPGFSDDDSPPASNLSSMQRAIVTIQKMRAKIETLERTRIEPIAIVGMACRVPGGADTPEAFFKILEEGVDTITEVPPERWRVEPEGPNSEGEARALRWGSFLKDIDRFDASFFGISPREAESLDPQHRLLLEVTWEALERAGQLPERLMGTRCGVFVGIWAPDYQLRVLNRDPNDLDAYCFTGTVLSTAAGRLSYTLGVQGPCMSIDTACSSSLTAIHLACQSLRNGESTMAIAGGVNLMLAPTTTKLLSKTQALSPDGRCKTFDARANGYVRGEGCGMLVLKRLGDAERDGDTVLALIRGSAVNQDGRSTGLTAPNVLSQQALLRQALENARLAPQDIAYLETHGTGTSLGDPIEVEAIKTVLGAPRERGATCFLGAVKSNIGHLEAAAGVAGLIKVVLAMQNEKIPGNLHFRSLNPRIDLRGTSLEIAQTAQPWTPGIRPRYAGVSSFGISGTNAHVIIEEPPRNLEEALLEEEASTCLLPISAKTPEALRAHAQAFRDMLKADQSPRLVDIVHTASARRSHYVHRLSIVGRTKEEMAQQLDAHLRGETPPGVAEGKSTPARAKVVFVFSGQGSQWLGMGRQLYETDSSFRSIIDTCDNLMTSRLNWSILDELDAPEAMSRVNETQVAQPLLFAVQIALVEMLRSWGISPDAMIGYSVGEIAAAHIAGILSLDEAIRLVAIRGRIMQKATGMGKMVSVFMTPDEAQVILTGYEDRVSIAAINDPGSVVLSGQPSAIDDIIVRCEKHGYKVRPLGVNYAFHSPQMDTFERELVDRLTRVDARRATLAMYSTVLSDCVDGKELDAQYWGKNIRNTVHFAGAVSAAIRDGYQLFLEVGPTPELVSHVQRCLAAKKSEGYVLGTLRRGYDDRRALLETAGGLYTRGCAVEWARILPNGGRSVPLPTYPWQRERYWVEPPQTTKVQLTSGAAPEHGRNASRSKIVFVFPGQGSQWLGMGRQLLHTEPAFRAALEQCDEAIQKEADFSILNELQADELTSRFDEIDVLQPLLFAIEVALAALWRAKGVEPDCVVGHSMGEVAAAYVAGILNLDDAVKVICRRSQLLKRIRGQGAMALVELPIAEAEAAIVNYTDRLSVAVSNGPRSTVLAGEPRALDDVLAMLEKRRVYCRHVKVDVASHSPQVDPLRGDLLSLLHDVRPSTSTISMWSTVTRERLNGVELVAAYWAANLREPVHFSNVMQSLMKDGYHLFVELSPHPILTVSIEENLREIGANGIAIASMRREADERQTMLDALTSLQQHERTLSRSNALSARASNSTDVVDPFADDLFEITWQPSELATPPENELQLSGPWLVLMDAQGLGKSLCDKLRARANRVVEVSARDEYARLGQDAFCLNPTDTLHWEQMLSAAFGKSGCQGIIDCLPLDTAPFREMTDDTLAVDLKNATFSALRLVQAILKRSWRDTPRLYILTRGAQSVGNSDGPLSATQAMVWGFGRVMAIEQPDMGCFRIDMPPRAAPDEAALVLQELAANANEDEIAFRSGNRYVSRLVRGTWMPNEPSASTLDPAGGRPYRLGIREPGAFERLALQPMERSVPGRNEVEIEVDTAGLTFTDVLLAMGDLPDAMAMGNSEGPRLGCECAGRIVRCGEGVSDIEVGQEVIALASSALASHVIANRSLVIPKPSQLSWAESATFPIAFLTSYYALAQVARLRKGERILIHCGAGGVGMAAIQWAQHVGAEIFATAGNEEKRAFLRTLGVQHVMDSRSLSFVEEVKRATGGQGVDVVLSSLSGEFITAGYGLLREQGRFVDIGQRDNHQNHLFGARPFLDGRSFSLVDIRGMISSRPDFAASLLQEVARLFAAGIFKPLPCRMFSIANATEAFVQMTQGKHTGKLALAVHSRDLRASSPMTGEIQIRSDSTYLITTADDGLGLSLADWLVQQGARYVVLAGDDLPTAESESAIANMRRLGAIVHPMHANVAKRADVEAIIARIETEMPPLRGVAHTAAVVADQALADMDEGSFFEAIEPKVLGGCNLHNATRKLPLDFFIVYSSAASLIGAPRKANGAAANAFVDALCRARIAEGLPAMSIQWGGIADADIAGSGHRGQQDPRSPKSNHLTAADRDAILRRLLAAPRAEAGVMRFDVRQWLGTFPQLAARPFFAELRRARRNEMGNAQSQAFRDTILNAAPEDRLGLLEARVRQIVADVLHTNISRIERTVPFREIGVDSLMSVEVRNRLEKDLGLQLPATLLFTYTHPADLAQYLFTQVRLDRAPEPLDAPTPPTLRQGQSVEANLDNVDDPELFAMLDEELALAYKGPPK